METNSTRRSKPNILITGTPGTGKTTTASALAASTQLRHINIVDLVKEKNLNHGFNDEIDLICNEINHMMELGGNIVDYHVCYFFLEEWFDLVVVLQTEISELYDRLINRDYSDSKLKHDIECEVFEVLLEDAKSSYSEDIVKPMKSNTLDDVNSNVDTLMAWVQGWQPNA
ncbi:adenylate kinase isoenzyme 6 homolog [Impatiens glandulifera]|uniref:adenylate kinase isoenzyme 6 homolog n=1 Tax=Impatiens glandulifera TaxID=253017 RepID=UPI001FB17ADA|nr:adenylate kinase isoenzyme 6 homolog [Impatiens glandulifera]